jgi:hypothetical protein
LKEEALDRTIWRAHFGRGFGPVVRQTTKWMNYDYDALRCDTRGPTTKPQGVTSYKTASSVT